MKRFNHLRYFTFVAILVFLTILLSCNTLVKENEPNSKSFIDSTNLESKESIPDSVIQFLITSAAKDFNEHQPPTVIDLRDVKAGYFSSGNERTYLICGEFLSQEKRNWESFTTIKTSGYEQYLGSSIYCQKATFVVTDSNRLSVEIKSKLTNNKK